MEASGRPQRSGDATDSTGPACGLRHRRRAGRTRRADRDTCDEIGTKQCRRPLRQPHHAIERRRDDRIALRGGQNRVEDRDRDLARRFYTAVTPDIDIAWQLTVIAAIVMPCP